jgi:hypothetical protein
MIDGAREKEEAGYYYLDELEAGILREPRQFSRGKSSGIYIEPEHGVFSEADSRHGYK